MSVSNRAYPTAVEGDAYLAVTGGEILQDPPRSPLDGGRSSFDMNGDEKDAATQAHGDGPGLSSPGARNARTPANNPKPRFLTVVLATVPPAASSGGGAHAVA
ncbi:hypothetical protein PUNSTDRAFT_133948 [Punctularia strigosozonata HHB-11173 SS5]|uniref:uncharacterized protein n=1 Tax=Punctularia strigosozonata (strain HHB-11173) TaxID=741275 RepID=UPI0004418274|nr:uncharacterized protein PUNSTDRAFT_133948 [Punctularia strigosozonata HHB-11173 SS5]EIN08767.1 hypothetical protein PUNSTDRAFT_133948 [Punctularia strigosozonata HHB-11173 SS5]